MPPLQPSFAALGVPADLVGALDRQSITEPFPIQAATLPDALAGRDVCGKAPTGSGKTLAFGLGALARLGDAPPRPGRPRALVLTPTRELAAQVCTELQALGAPRRLKMAAFYGGVGYGPQLKALSRGVDVAVACPGRLADLVARGDVRLDAVEIVVLDEADRMADMGFLPEVTRLLDRIPEDRQTLLFSATLDGDIDILVRKYQRNPARHELVDEGDAGSRAVHLFWRSPSGDRVARTADVVRAAGSTIVFSRTKHGADRIAQQLGRQGVAAAAIHGARSQRQRERALDQFSRGAVDVLVATDVAARGIHVDDVRAVVHFDLPADHKDYVHRSGRTARAGAAGVVVSLVTPDKAGEAKRLQRRLELPLGTTLPEADAVAAVVGDLPTRPVRPASPVGQDRPRGQQRSGGRPAAGGARRPPGAPHRKGRGKPKASGHGSAQGGDGRPTGGKAQTRGKAGAPARHFPAGPAGRARAGGRPRPAAKGRAR